MAISQNPLTGRTRGKFGTAVFTKIGKKNIVKAYVENINDANSASQQLYRSRLKFLTAFINSLAPIFFAGFSNFAKVISAQNLAFKSMFNNVTGSIELPAISFDDIMLCPKYIWWLWPSGVNWDKVAEKIAFESYDFNQDDWYNTSGWAHILWHDTSSDVYMITMQAKEMNGEAGEVLMPSILNAATTEVKILVTSGITDFSLTSLNKIRNRNNHIYCAAEVQNITVS